MKLPNKPAKRAPSPKPASRPLPNEEAFIKSMNEMADEYEASQPKVTKGWSPIKKILANLDGADSR
jgi:hypothetical protein